MNDVGRKQCQPQNAAHIRLIDLLGVGKFGDSEVHPAFQHAPPAMGAGKCLDDGAVDARPRWRQGPAVKSDLELGPLG